MLVKLQKGQAGCKEVTGKQDWILYNTVEIDHDDENVPRGKRTDVVVGGGDDDAGRSMTAWLVRILAKVGISR